MATFGGRDVSKYLSSKQADADKDLAAEWAKLEELYTKKLWHQLTLKLLTFVKQPALQTGTSLIELYSNFIQEFENKINPLSLVEIIAPIIGQYTDPEQAVKFLEQTEVKVKSSVEAVALCKVFMGQICLNKLKDQDRTKKIIEDTEKLLNDIDGITSIHGRFYLLASHLYRIAGKHAEYYRAALRFLGCTELSDLSKEEQQQHAFCLGLAALLGEGVYNFGELLAHPVLESLRGTDRTWLVDLLYGFNCGSIADFEKMRPKWSSVPDLAANELTLRQKISLLCLMEMTFKRPATDRQLTFEEIAHETRLPISEVELLVMKALAQGLVRGAIDQVALNVHMTWVQPRVLDKHQISNMIQRLDMWCKDVQTMEMLMETKAHDILTL